MAGYRFKKEDLKPDEQGLKLTEEENEYAFKQDQERRERLVQKREEVEEARSQAKFQERIDEIRQGIKRGPRGGRYTDEISKNGKRYRKYF